MLAMMPRLNRSAIRSLALTPSFSANSRTVMPSETMTGPWAVLNDGACAGSTRASSRSARRRRRAERRRLRPVLPVRRRRSRRPRASAAAHVVGIDVVTGRPLDAAFLARRSRVLRRPSAHAARGARRRADGELRAGPTRARAMPGRHRTASRGPPGRAGRRPVRLRRTRRAHRSRGTGRALAARPPDAAAHRARAWGAVR